VNEEEKQAQMQDLLNQPVLARLATANPKTLQPHVVPVWFWWDGQSIWISAFNSTRKVKDLQKNRRCAVLIEPRDPQDDGLQGILFEGEAELITGPTVAELSARVYVRYVGEEGLKAPDVASWMVDPENTIIKLTPEKTRAW